MLKTVIVVDDDASFRHSTVRLLQTMGVPAKGLASAHDLVSGFDDSACFLIDLSAVRALGRKAADLSTMLGGRCLFITGSVDDAGARAEHGLEPGDYLVKPFTREQLMAAMARVGCA